MKKSFPKTSINCLIMINLKPFTKPYFTKDYENLDNAYFIAKMLKKGKKQQKYTNFNKKWGRNYQGDISV